LETGSEWKDEFVKLLGCVDPKSLEIDRAFLLKHGHLPKKIYKYRKCSEFALKNLEFDSIWLASPYNYNDPFECIEHIDLTSINENSIRLNFENILSGILGKYDIPEGVVERARTSKTPLQEIGRHLFKVHEKMDDDKIDTIFAILTEATKKITDEIIETQNRRRQDLVKMCSFSERNDSILMWSHYSDEHKGICIEYDLETLPPDDIRLRMLFPVLYSDDVYDATPHIVRLMEKKDFNNLYITISSMRKATEWMYEKEWRLIIIIGPSFTEKEYRFPKASKVFLGSKITDANKEKVLEICKGKGIEVYQGKPSLEKYRIDFKKIL
jgi:hypothetical protein